MENKTFINNILRQIPNKNRRIAIMDDCLVHSKFVDNLHDLTNLFQSLIDNSLKISPKKYQFFQTELVYMGLKFLIYNGRPSITPMKDKCEAIRCLDPPKTVRDCRKFCGMVNFLVTFLKVIGTVHRNYHRPALIITLSFQIFPRRFCDSQVRSAHVLHGPMQA